jgi:UDP-glucose 4-epimerase
VREVIDACRKITGHPIPAVEKPRLQGDPPRLVASSEKAKEKLGWKPQFENIEVIVESAWRWHRAHPDGYSD